MTEQDCKEWSETLVYRICELRAYVANHRERLSGSAEILATADWYQLDRHLSQVSLLRDQLRALGTLEELAEEWGITVDCSTVEDDFTD